MQQTLGQSATATQEQLLREQLASGAGGTARPGTFISRLLEATVGPLKRTGRSWQDAARIGTQAARPLHSKPQSKITEELWLALAQKDPAMAAGQLQTLRHAALSLPVLAGMRGGQGADKAPVVRLPESPGPLLHKRSGGAPSAKGQLLSPGSTWGKQLASGSTTAKEVSTIALLSQFSPPAKRGA